MNTFCKEYRSWVTTLITGLAFILLLNGCATVSGGSSRASKGRVVAAWTQITGNSVTDETSLAGMARFVILGKDQNCGQYTIDHHGGGVPAPFKARPNPNADKFPITVCETPFDPNWTSAVLSLHGQKVRLGPASFVSYLANFPTLHPIGRSPTGKINMATLGDTGCRDDSSQACDSSKTWPFAKIADDIASQSPEFIFHVGDYRYSHKGHSDQWQYWDKEFFQPTLKLSRIAPWVFVRGNHEACNYSGTSDKEAPWGTGWFYLLQHSNVDESIDCSDEASTYPSPWYFDVALKKSTPGAAHRFVVIDSSSGEASDQLENNFIDAIKLTGQAASVWWVSHRPLWASYNGGAEVVVIQESMQQDLTSAIKKVGMQTECWPIDNLPCSLKLVLGGHIHMLQTASFYQTDSSAQKMIRPQQVVVGNGGVNLVNGFDKNPCSVDIPPDKSSGLGKSLASETDWAIKFGYLLWQWPAVGEPSGWKPTERFYPEAKENVAAKNGGEAGLSPCAL